MYLSFKPAEEKGVCVTHTYFSIYQKLGKKGGGKNQKNKILGWLKSSFRYFCKILYELFGQLNKRAEKNNSKHDCNKCKQNKWTRQILPDQIKLTTKSNFKLFT